VTGDCQGQPGGEERYRAVQLGVPSVLAQFTTVYKDQQGEIVDERNYNIDLNSGNIKYIFQRCLV
jgi:hypothetical protein